MKKFCLFVVLCSFLSLFADNITMQGKYEEMALYNKNNRKIYTYYLVKPAQELNMKVNGVESFSIISRVILKQNDKAEYDYELTIDNKTEKIYKTCKLSDETKGIGGETISSYNKMALDLDNAAHTIKIRNISAHNLLFKFNADEANQSNNEIDYVRFTPDVYGTEEVLLIDDTAYTYYTMGEEGIQLTLEGPVVLKILSRYIFDSNIVNTNNYRFRVLDNDKLVNKFTESAFKSEKSILKNDETKIPSTGDVNIIKLDKGMHRIKIMNGSVNRDL
ncbi:MAG TPA: hypothetical protein PLD62_10520, partial [Candidatus Cloacimonadota bacterium]|nr:hypothetical protein [Candidatus Cloacimonadota bacterium]